MQKKNNDTILFKYINEKVFETLEKNGMTVIAPMNSAQMEKAFELIQMNTDLAYGTIKINGIIYIVIKSKKFKELNYNNAKKALQDANNAYIRHDYKSAIDSYLQALKISRPKAEIYGRLGISYLRSSESKSALDCFIIAEFLSQRQKKKNDYTSLIRYTQNVLKNDENYKPECIVELSTFSDNIHYYGIDNFPLINDYLTEMIKQGISLQEACFSLNIGLEQTNIIYLIYARQCYFERQFKKGDMFFVAVEKSKNKTKKVIDIMNEIKARRKFYQYSAFEAQANDKAYTLSLKKLK